MEVSRRDDFAFLDVLFEKTTLDEPLYRTGPDELQNGTKTFLSLILHQVPKDRTVCKYRRRRWDGIGIFSHRIPISPQNNTTFIVSSLPTSGGASYVDVVRTTSDLYHFVPFDRSSKACLQRGLEFPL